MEFDIFNPDTWHLVKEDDVFHVDGRDVYVSDFSARMKLHDFVDFLLSFFKVVKEQVGELTLEEKQKYIKKLLIQFHKYNTIEGKAELPTEPLALTPETEDKEESGFNPFEENTWNLASDRRIMRVRNVLIYSDKENEKNTVYTSEKEWIRRLKFILKLNKNTNAPLYRIVQSQLEFDYLFCCPKDLAPVMIVNGFPFSKALCDTCRDTEKETLKTIADAMNYCISNNLKKYQYKQYFFDNFIPANQEFFVELYFAEQDGLRKTVDDLVISFYCEFEPETKEEVDKLIDNSLYLSAHKELIPAIRKHFKERYDIG